MHPNSLSRLTRLAWTSILNSDDRHTTGTVIYRNDKPVAFFFSADLAYALLGRLQGDGLDYQIEDYVPWAALSRNSPLVVSAIARNTFVSAFFLERRFGEHALRLLSTAPGIGLMLTARASAAQPSP